MAISEAFTNTATIGATEYSLPNNSTTLTPQTGDGIVQAWVDFAAMAAGDQYRVTVLEKVISGGTQRTIMESILTGAQPGPWVCPAFVVLHGWDITVQKVAGTDRSISWSIRQVA